MKFVNTSGSTLLGLKSKHGQPAENTYYNRWPLTPAARTPADPCDLTQVHIVKAGALPSLVRLTALGREKLDVSRYCGMTLSNLACHRQNRVPVVQAGGLKPLCDMAFDGERLEMQRAAGLALYNLSCAAANQVSCRCSYYMVDEAHFVMLLGFSDTVDRLNGSVLIVTVREKSVSD